jgi:hypothetical protein
MFQTNLSMNCLPEATPLCYEMDHMEGPCINGRGGQLFAVSTAWDELRNIIGLSTCHFLLYVFRKTKIRNVVERMQLMNQKGKTLVSHLTWPIMLRPKQA